MNTKTRSTKTGALPAFLTRDPYITRLVLVLVLLLAFFAIVKSGPFFAVRTWQSMAVQFPEFGLMSLGVMFTMFTAGIDLSAVAIANVTSICAALALRAVLEGQPAATAPSMATATAVALGIALAVGALCGLVNGVLIAVAKIPPILATLGTLELFGGIAIVLTDGKPVSGVPEAFGAVFASRVGGVVPMPLVVFLVCALVAAAFSGLKVTSLLIRTYILSGVMAAMAGLVMLANYNSAKSDYGASYTLLTVLIVVLGGVNPNGGSGRLSGVLFAIVMLQVLSSGLNMFPTISNFYRPLIWGAVLLFVICMNEGAFSVRRLIDASRRLLKKGTQQ